MGYTSGCQAGLRSCWLECRVDLLANGTEPWRFEMPILWRDEYAVGIAALDDQHKQLVFIINDIEMVSHLNPSRPGYKASVDAVFERIFNYAALHFATEEALMDVFEYPGASPHKRTHAGFTDLVRSKKALVDALLDSGSPLKAQDELAGIHAYLQKWLVEHMVGSDKEYVEHMFERIARSKS